ncbi:MAG: hypothetical protein HY856_13960 [Burkholderiales bacterium]|nr:hypothetical protein [Burkholderiales bacterium]
MLEAFVKELSEQEDQAGDEEQKRRCRDLRREADVLVDRLSNNPEPTSEAVFDAQMFLKQQVAWQRLR